MAKRITKVLTAILVLSMLCTQLGATAFASTNEETPNTVEIGTAKELMDWASSITNDKVKYTGARIEITNDIDLSGYDWVPINAQVDGEYSALINTVIDGNGHTISNMTAKQNSKNGCGFIGETGANDTGKNASLTIENITFRGAKITPPTSSSRVDGAGYVGVVVGHGYCDTYGSNANVELHFNGVHVVDSQVISSQYCGAILGYSNGDGTKDSVCFDGCSVKNTFVGGYSAYAGAFMSFGVTDVTVKNSVVENTKIYSCSIRSNANAQDFTKNDEMWISYRYNSKTYTVSDYTQKNSSIVYPVFFYSVDKEGTQTLLGKKYIDVNSSDALSASNLDFGNTKADWFLDVECTQSVGEVVAAKANTNTDMYPNNLQTLVNEDPETHSAISLYSNNMQYSVYYDANCETFTGTTEDNNTYLVGTDVAVLSNGYTREGYTFKSWNTQADGNGTSYDSENTMQMPKENVTLYAIWEEKKVVEDNTVDVPDDNTPAAPADKEVPEVTKTPTSSSPTVDITDADTPASGPSEDDTPSTGDASNNWLLITGFAAVGLVLTTIFVRRKTNVR